MINDIEEPLLDNQHYDDSQQLDRPINSNSPRDRFYASQILFFLVGLSQLLPWNFLITATDYWMFKFRDLNGTSKILLTDEHKSHLQTYFDSYLSIASNTPFLLVFFMSLTRQFKQISDKVRISCSFVCLIAVFIVLNSFVLVDTDNFQFTFLWLVLSLVLILNFAVGTLQGTFAGIASLFPPACMHYMVTGQATSGLFASLAQLLSLAGNWSIIWSTFVYFALANFVALFTSFLYWFVQQTEYYNYYQPISSDISVQTEQSSLTLYWKVFKKMWPFCVTMIIIFWVTLSIFPAVLVLESPKGLTISRKMFLPVCCFLVFNIGDFLGRFLGKFILMPKQYSCSLLVLSLARVVFIPLFLFCNAQPRKLPVLFESGVYYIVFNLLFALSNGYLVLNVFVNGPLSVPPEHRHISGFFLILSLGCGLSLGSISSPFFVSML